MFCEKCGTMLPTGTKFCTTCGTPVPTFTPSAPAIEPVTVEPAAPIENANVENATVEAASVEAAAPIETANVAPSSVDPLSSIPPIPAAPDVSRFVDKDAAYKPKPEGEQADLKVSYPASDFSGEGQNFQQNAYQQNAYQQNTYQQNAYQQNPNGQPVYQQPVYQQPTPDGKVKHQTLALLMGIFSIVMAFPCCILFGVIACVIAIVLGILGIIFSIEVRKNSNNQKGTGGLVCAIIGIVLGGIFTIGCTACSACTCGYGCYGCVGACFGCGPDVANVYDDLSDIYNFANDLDSYDFNDYDFNDFNYDDFNYDDFSNYIDQDELDELQEQLDNFLEQFGN